MQKINTKKIVLQKFCIANNSNSTTKSFSVHNQLGQERALLYAVKLIWLWPAPEDAWEAQLKYFAKLLSSGLIKLWS